jgi:hypothetical protein
VADQFEPTEAKSSKQKKSPPALRVADREGRPDVILGPNTHVTTREMIAALGADPELYQRSGALSHVIRQEEDEPGYAKGTPRIRECPTSWLRDRVSEYARCMTLKKGKDQDSWVHVPPPTDAVIAVKERGSWTGIPQLESVVEAPTMRVDGSILQDPGYDRAARVLYIPSAAFPRIGDAPSHSDAVLAYAHLSSLFAKFPYVNESHRSAAVATILTILIRGSLVGSSVPCFVFDAAAPRSGKSLQMDVISIVAAGRMASRMTFPADRGEVNEKELESVLASYAMAGVAIVPFDNFACAFGGAPLDKVITATNEVDLRVLGKTELRRVPWRSTVLASGNNVEFMGDMLPRVLCIRLESPLENPETRTDVNADDLRAYATARRPELVGGALTLVRAYVSAGSPPQQLPRWGGFDTWVTRVASALVWAGAPDPMGARRGLRADEDPTRGAQRVLVSTWARVCEAAGSPSITVSKALSKLYPAPRGDEPPDGFDELREALEHLTAAKPGHAPSSRRLGEAIRKAKAKNVGGLKLVPDGESGGVAKWRTITA